MLIIAYDLCDENNGSAAPVPNAATMFEGEGQGRRDRLCLARILARQIRPLKTVELDY